MVVVLQLVFRRVAGVVLPLATMLLSLVSTLGLMALLEIPLSLTTEILPPFLLTVGVCYSVHILVIFFQRQARGAGREEAIVYALGHSGLAVFLAALTTAGGLFSFAWAEVAPVSELGLVGPIGVMLAMLFSLVLLPALLAVVPLRRGAQAKRGSNRPLQRFVVGCGHLSARHPWKTVAASALALALIGAGATRLRVANDYMLWFPDGEPLKTATRFIDRELSGAVTLEAVIELDEENGLHRPSLLRRIEALGAANESVRRGELFIGKTMSVVDVLKDPSGAQREPARVLCGSRRPAAGQPGAAPVREQRDGRSRGAGRFTVQHGAHQHEAALGGLDALPPFPGGHAGARHDDPGGTTYASV